MNPSPSHRSVAESIPLKCPVCGARFRGSATCSRCGTDLTTLMSVAARAWAARERCRTALRRGDLVGALRWATVARKLHASQAPIQAAG